MKPTTPEPPPDLTTYVKPYPWNTATILNNSISQESIPSDKALLEQLRKMQEGKVPVYAEW